MNYQGKHISLKQLVCLVLYYGIARHLPQSNIPIIGEISKKIRYSLVKRIFKKCGKKVNVEHGVNFGWGINVEIGNNSGIGIDSVIPYSIRIGDNVMMGPECYILGQNHRFDRTDIPMILQGYNINASNTIIEDDVWIGRCVTFTPGRHVKRGTIVGACCLLCKDFPEYSIVGGNPSKLIRSRKQEYSILTSK